MSREETLKRYPAALAVHRSLVRVVPVAYAIADLLYQVGRSAWVTRRKPWRSVDRDVAGFCERSSDTLFVLGSGMSINELTDEAWREVAESDSLGLNFWLIHRFVPLAYVQEWIPTDDLSSVHADRQRVREAIISRRGEELGNARFFFRAPATRRYRRQHFDPSSVYAQIPVDTERVRITSDLDLMPLEKRQFARAMVACRRLGLLRRSKQWTYLVTARGTVLWSVMFAIRMGYRRVVLLGVDLQGPEYFYDAVNVRSVVPGLPTPPSTQSGTIHRTNDPRQPGPTMEEMLLAMRDTVLHAVGVEIAVGHPSSALAAHFPTFSWKTATPFTSD